jgi:MAE_28990/MAE_18760-like HEPN
MSKSRSEKVFEIVRNFSATSEKVFDYTDLEDLFTAQKQNLDRYFEFLNSNINLIDLKTFKIMKSTIFLLLYNLMESTVNNSLALIHNVISDEKTKYSDLSEPLKKCYIEYYLRKQGFQNITKKQKRYLVTIFSNNFIATNHVINFPYQEFLKYNNSLISGNIDQQKINEIGEIYGFKVDRKRKELELLIVKKVRNSLGHGDISFSDCTKDIVIEDIFEIKEQVIQYFENYLSIIKNYIENKFYLKNSNKNLVSTS